MTEQRIVPMLGYEDAAAAINWLCGAFGFAEDSEKRYTEQDGTVSNAELHLGGAADHARDAEQGVPVTSAPSGVL